MFNHANKKYKNESTITWCDCLYILLGATVLVDQRQKATRRGKGREGKQKVKWPEKEFYKSQGGIENSLLRG